MSEVARQENVAPVALALAERWGIPPNSVGKVLTDSVFSVSPALNHAELAGAMMLCQKYDLDPFAKQVYVTRIDGKLQMIVPIDGWTQIANREPGYDGCEFEDGPMGEDGKLAWIQCSVFVKGRSRPTRLKEYMKECIRPNMKPWQSHPNRMLRHKAFIQAARLAFSLGGIMDSDEAEAMKDAEVVSIRGMKSEGRQPGYVLAVPGQATTAQEAFNRTLESEMDEAFQTKEPAPQKPKRGRPPRVQEQPPPKPEPMNDPRPEEVDMVHREPGDDTEEIQAETAPKPPNKASLRERVMALRAKGLTINAWQGFNPNDIADMVRYEKLVDEAEARLEKGTA